MKILILNSPRKTETLTKLLRRSLKFLYLLKKNNKQNKHLIFMLCKLLSILVLTRLSRLAHTGDQTPVGNVVSVPEEKQYQKSNINNNKCVSKQSRTNTCL